MKNFYFLYNKYRIAVYILPLLVLTACKKFVQIPDAPNEIPSSSVFADSVDAVSGIIGMYISASGYATSPILLNGGISINTGLASDEIYPTTGISSDLQFYENAVSSVTNSPNNTFWSNGYALIYQANACIEGVESSNGLSASLKNQLIGEARLVRALVYFNLVNIYGDVPLIITTSYNTNATLPRTASDSVYNQIIADLNSAASILPISYPSSGRVRPNRMTALAFLARVYLYRKSWSDAESTASQVINSGIYFLEPTLSNVFLAGSNEAIWQIIPVQPGYETAEGYAFVPSSQGFLPQYVVSPFLFGAFESGDLRFNNWLDSTMVNGKVYYYPYKYKLGYDGSTSNPIENYMMFRLAEQYLIRAEARARLGNLSDATNDVNIIRSRAKLANVSPNTLTDLIAAIFQERRIELFCEWGNRWYDLKRTGLVDSVMGSPGGVCAAKGGHWVSTSQLFPIPGLERQRNPYLTQNPGYN